MMIRASASNLKSWKCGRSLHFLSRFIAVMHLSLYFTALLVLCSANLVVGLSSGRLKIGNTLSRKSVAVEKLTPRSLSSTSSVTVLRGGFTLPVMKNGLSIHSTKVVLQVGLTAFNMLCWALPLRNRSFSENKALLSYANAFAGGIFLMLSFGHLLPESMAGMAKNTPEGGTKALVYCLVGYMAMLFIEKVAFATHEEPPETGPVDGPSLTGTNKAPCHVEMSNRQKSAIALCCAMSVHSFFEAAALGLATDFTSAYMMSACIALHQPAESVALLVAFLKAEMPTRRTVLWLSGFSVVSIAGVLAGLLVNRLASSRVEAIVMAITAGTFIYVGATEIANEEFEETVSKKERLLRYLCYAGGMFVMHSIAAFSEKFER